MPDVPQQWRRKYDNVLRSSGTAAAAAWLAAKNARTKSGGSARRRPKRGGEARSPFQIGVPECALKYAKLVANPFQFSTDACFPIFPTPPTQKISVFIRGTLKSGTTGFGYVIASPYLALANDQIGTDIPLFHSTTGYAAAVSTVVAGTGVTPVQSNSPYVDADFGAGSTQIQARVMVAGLRVRYSGPSDTRAGTLVGYVNPDHHGLNLISVATLMSNDAVTPVRPSDDWHSLRWVPKNSDFHSTQTVAAHPHSMLIEWSGATADTSLDYEFFVQAEIAGTQARGKTMSHAAPVQAQALVDVAASSPSFTSDSEMVTDIVGALDSTAQVGVGLAKASAGIGTAFMTMSSVYAAMNGVRRSNRLRSEL